MRVVTEIISFAVIVVLLLQNCKMTFKLAYYEQKLLNRCVNVEKVKDMAWYKLWVN